MKKRTRHGEATATAHIKKGSKALICIFVALAVLMAFAAAEIGSIGFVYCGVFAAGAFLAWILAWARGRYDEMIEDYPELKAHAEKMEYVLTGTPTVTCEVCGYEAPVGTTLCPRCGSRLKDDNV